MAQEFTREKLSVADAFGNPVYIGSTKTTIHTVPANSQDTITLYLKFGRVSRCEVTLFRSDGTNDYELPERYMGSSGSIVPVEIKNVQAGNTIKAQLSGGSPNTVIYVTSGERTNDHVQTISRNSTYEIAIYDSKFQTGTPKYLTVDDFNWGTYTAPTDFRYLRAFKYFPDTGHLAMCISTSTGDGWWVHDIYENKVVFYSSSYQDGTSQYGNVWIGDKYVAATNNPIYVIDFTDRVNPTITSTSVSQVGNYCYGMVKVSSTVFVTLSSDASYPISTWILNADNTVTYVATGSSPQYAYQVYAADTFADGNFYLAHFSYTTSYYGGLKQIDTSTGAITNISTSISSPFDSRSTYKVVACPERNEFWMFRGNASYDIGKITTAGVITNYANTRDIVDNVQQGRCFYNAADDLIYVMNNDDKWYGWDPDTQAWTRDSLIFTDSSWQGYDPNSLGTLNNGTNDMLFGAKGTLLVWRNLDTNAEGTVGTSTSGGWVTEKHTGSSRAYVAGQNGYISVVDMTGTPSLEQSFNAAAYGSFSNYCFQLYVDGNVLYYSDYNSNIFKATINATNGQLTYDSKPLTVGSTSYREHTWAIDETLGYHHIFYSNQGIRRYDLSTGNFDATYSLADLGIESGISDYSSGGTFFDGDSTTSGNFTAQYDKANNYAYVGFRYYNGSTWQTGVMKLDLSQIGVSTSSTFVGFASVVNTSSYGYLSSLESDGYIMFGLTDGQSGIVNTATMTSESVTPSYATGSVRGRHYSSIASALYFTNSSNYLEGQKYNAPAGEMPVASDFQVLTRSGYNSSSEAIMGSLGSHTPSDEDYSDSTAAQRAALDIEKGNGATGHVNRVTTTA
jgi:hypothetical protein